MSFEIGETVEVIDNEDGMEGSYFRGQVIDRSPGRRTIRYHTLLADDGSPLEEVISVRSLRPPPPTVLARFHLGDMVDVWHNDVWWVGRYVRREGPKYTVFFENKAPKINMFPIQEHNFVFIKSGRNWRKEESGSMSRDRVEGIGGRRKVENSSVDIAIHCRCRNRAMIEQREKTEETGSSNNPLKF
ncbi:hypothetical protein LXL04_037661 [Taraxacum kok-saghyz]